MGGISTAPWIVAYGVVAVCIIFSNLLMTVVFAKSRAVRRMRTTLFLIGMTAADLVVGVVAIPMYMAILWAGARLGRTFHISYQSIEIASSCASLFLLAVIALERVYAVFWPYRHRSLSRTPYWCGLGMSLLLAALQSVSYLLWAYGFISLASHFHLASGFMAAVLIVIVVSYVVIWMKMKTARVEGLQQRRDLQERKLAKTLAILTGVFLATWLPFIILFVLFHINKEFHPILQGLPSEALDDVVYACKLLHYSNSFMNPVVYSLRIPQVRSTLAQMFCGGGQRVVAPTALRLEVRRGEGEGGGTTDRREEVTNRERKRTRERCANR